MSLASLGCESPLARRIGAAKQQATNADIVIRAIAVRILFLQNQGTLEIGETFSSSRC